MSSITQLHSDSDNDNDDTSDQNASQPLLLQSSSSMQNAKNCSKSTIKLPTLVNQNKCIPNNANEYSRVLIKIGHLANIKLKRTDNRRANREKCRRINIGLFTISFLTVIYFCVSMNLNVDKPTPQIIVDIPPVDANLLGLKGIINLCGLLALISNLLTYLAVYDFLFYL